MANVRQLKDHGAPIFPITHVSLVKGMEYRALMDATYAWDGTGTPDVSKIPAGVVVTYNGTDYTGTLVASASTTGRFYLVPSTTVQGEWDRYMTDGTGSSYAWKAAGNTSIPSPAVVDNETTDDPTKPHSAAGGKRLKDQLGELEAKVDENEAESELYHYGEYVREVASLSMATTNLESFVVKPGTYRFEAYAETVGTSTLYVRLWNLDTNTSVNTRSISSNGGSSGVDVTVVTAFNGCISIYTSTYAPVTNVRAYLKATNAKTIVNNNEKMDGKLVYTTKKTNASGNFTFSVPGGYLYRFENDVTGTMIDANCKIQIMEGTIWGTVGYKFKAGTPIYIPVFASATNPNWTIRVDYGFSTETHTLNFRAYQSPLLNMSSIRSLDAFAYAHPLKSTFAISWLQGEWTSMYERNTSTTWCSTKIQFNRGKKVKITFSSDYVVQIGGFIFDETNNTFEHAISIVNIASDTVFDTTNWCIWYVKVRRSNYASLNPAGAASAVTITDMGGEFYAKAITPEEFDEFLPDEDPTEINELKVKVQRNFRLGQLEIGQVYHHLNTEVEHPIIPSQSLFDIAYAKSLGFKVIEGNCRLCSDGVFVIKHGGTGGTLGNGLTFAEDSGIDASTTFASVTSTQLRQNVTYDSVLQKYCTHIPTLDEFCAKCAELDMIPFLRGVNASGLAIARKYLPDERIIVEGVQRGDFRGLMTLYGGLTDPDEIVAVCENYGQPFFYGSSQIGSLSDADAADIFGTLHQNGYMIAGSYMRMDKYQQLRSMGLDLLASGECCAVPYFFHGNKLNILGCSDQQLTLNGATYDSTNKVITMVQGNTITVSSAELGANLSKLCLRIVFEGTVDIDFGPYETYRSFNNLVSDGESEIMVAEAIQCVGNTVLKIKAEASTTIKDINVYGSTVLAV